MMTYILQTIVFQLLFLAVYEWLLKKETFFQWNRLYLLITPLVALVLPFIKIPAFQTVIPQSFIVSLPEVSLGTTTTALENNLSTSTSSFSAFEIILVSGMAVSALLFIWKLYKIVQLKRKGKAAILGTTTLVHLPNSTDAFTFAGTIFLGESLNTQSQEHILAHEMVHIKQKHYLDLLYFEVLRIVFWFNPMVYLYQKRIATLHEYIADAQVASTTEKTSYYQNLLAEVFQTQTVSFVNTFFNHSLIKKRIVMLHKSKSKKAQLAKFLMLLPLIAGIMLYTSCSQDVPSENNQATSIEQKIEELKTALDNNPDGITAEQRKELMELMLNTSKNHKANIEVLNSSSNEDLSGVPFAVIDQVPLYPGCENLTSNKERKQCLSEKIDQLVKENFNSGMVNGLGLKGRQRIAVQFKIDKQGQVIDVVSRAPVKQLEEEAVRVINLLPQMQPGKQNNETVAVMYSLPILFVVEE